MASPDNDHYRCQARIRPFPNVTEIRCDDTESHTGTHRGVLRDYAYPGSETVLAWEPDDRRSFTGEWSPCSSAGCVLPGGHPRGHAT